MRNFFRSSAFTLVEIIVAITILAILWTISFIYLQWFTIDARDAKRATDTRNLLSKINMENAKWVLYSQIIDEENSTYKINDNLVIGGKSKTWYQGIVNFEAIKERQEAFQDPKNNDNYPFAYAIWYSNYDWNLQSYDFTQMAYVSEKTWNTKLIWDYHKFDVEKDSPSLFTDTKWNFYEDEDKKQIYDDAWIKSTAYYNNNITFTSPYWTMNNYVSEGIDNIINEMKALKIKYQMIDLGFFDKTTAIDENGQDEIHSEINGSMDEIHTLNLQEWINVSRALAPEIKLLGVVNGNTGLHIFVEETEIKGVSYTPNVTKSTMYENIANHCKYLVDTYDLDWITLDFEPLYNVATEDYIELIDLIRNKIWPDKIIALCSTIDSNALADANIALYRNKVDMYISMDYDTAKTTEDEYISYVAGNVKRISDVLKGSTTRYVPLWPWVYNNSEWHTIAENSRTHSTALENAITSGAEIFGSGVWWFPGVMNSTEDKSNFLEYWVNKGN